MRQSLFLCFSKIVRYELIFQLVRGFRNFVEHNKEDLHDFIKSCQTQNITAVCLEHCFLNSVINLCFLSYSFNTCKHEVAAA